MTVRNMKGLAKDSVLFGALVGRFERKLGRDRLLTIPAEWVTCLVECSFVCVMPDPRERCLIILPASLMGMELARLRSTLSNDIEMSKVLLEIGKVTERLVLDRRHRIRISDKLLDFAGIGNRALLFGSVHSVKVWDPDILEKQRCAFNEADQDERSDQNDEVE